MQVITTHLNADFDAIASMVAATKLYPQAEAVYPNSVNNNVKAYISLYKENLPIKSIKEIDLSAIKELIITDTRQPKRIGIFADYLDQIEEIYFYDHHPAAETDIVSSHSVAEQTGATTTLLLEKIFAKDIKINQFEATLFALGIYEGTGGLMFEQTTLRDVEVLHRLWQIGVNLRVINEFLSRPLTKEQRAVLDTLLAADVMSAPVRSITPDTTIAEAQELMLRYGHSGFPVQDGERLVGIISRRDLEKALHHKLGHAPVKGYMNCKPITVSPETPLHEVQHIMVAKDIGRLPVVNGKKVLGIITRTDVLRNLEGRGQKKEDSTLPAPGDDITQLLNERLPKRQQSLLYLIGQAADREQVRVHAVGGFIRDLLLGIPTHDIDLVVEPTAIPFAEKIKHLLGGKLITHEQFGTATLTLLDGMQIDFVTARQEFYASPAALPHVEQSNLKQDLFRRDFTINTLAVSLNAPHYGQLIDFFQGVADLQKQQLRVLYNLSFVEDPLRILRAIRFEQRFNFRLEENTQALLENAVQMRVLEKVSKERLYSEFKLLFQEEKIPELLLRIFSLGIDAFLFPAVNYNEELALRLYAVRDVLVWAKENWHDAEPSVEALYLSALLMDLPFQEARHLCRRLRLPREKMRLVLAALAALPSMQKTVRSNAKLAASELESCFRGQPVEALLLLLVTDNNEQTISYVKQYWEKIRHVKTEINGYDLEEMGFSPGPVFQKVLAAVRAARLDGVVHSREEELAFARERLQCAALGKEN
ncbi:MAG: CBS domain-containing protein [Firmicutes bacterium]|nr:CBS domain-containing protein [Bacillota bacterium]